MDPSVVSLTGSASTSNWSSAHRSPPIPLAPSTNNVPSTSSLVDVRVARPRPNEMVTTERKVLHSNTEAPRSSDHTNVHNSTVDLRSV